MIQNHIWNRVITPERLSLLIASIVGLASCINWYKSAYYRGEYFPLGGDSFYHAVRILTLQDTGHLIQFDPWIHIPEGSIITWPWGYDTIAAAFLWLVKNVTGQHFPDMMLLSCFPVLLFLLSIYLVHLLLTELNFKPINYALCILCYSLSPLVQGLYGFGRLDHHGAEQISFLAVILFSLKWISNSKSKTSPVLAGLTLGGCLILHTSLFILQLPVALYIALSWFRRQTPDHIHILGMTAFASTLVFSLPSLAIHQLLFEFSTHSWFHVYVSGGFMLFSFYIHRYNYSLSRAILLAALASLFAIPILQQSSAFDYLSGDLYNYKNISETISPLLGAKALGIDSLVKWYSGLIYLAPVVLVWSIWTLVKGNDKELFLSIIFIFGLMMSAVHFRFFVFGIFPLVFGIFYLLNRYLKIKTRYLWLYFTFTFVSTQAWSAVQLTRILPTANDADFRIMYPAFKSMRSLCNNGDKTILAANNDGHYIRYFSECRVISNMFILTRQHESKARLVDEMYDLSLEELSRKYPWINHVFIRIYPSDIRNFPKLKKLKADIMLNNHPDMRIISEASVYLNIDGNSFPAYRLVDVSK